MCKKKNKKSKSEPPFSLFFLAFFFGNDNPSWHWLLPLCIFCLFSLFLTSHTYAHTHTQMGFEDSCENKISFVFLSQLLFFLFFFPSSSSSPPFTGKFHDWGLAQWASWLVDLLFDSSDSSIDMNMQMLLGERYHRLNDVLPRRVDLDDCDRFVCVGVWKCVCVCVCVCLFVLCLFTFVLLFLVVVVFV